MINFILFIFGLTWILEFLQTLSNHLKPFFCAKKAKFTPGTWAVITACSDGIGKAFAESLAKRGLNIVQIDRNSSKLSECARNLKSKYKVEVKNIVKDFSVCLLNPVLFLKDVYKQTKGLDISVLVNNVGISQYRKKSKNKREEIWKQMTLNLFIIVLLKQLYENDLRNNENSWIVNLNLVTIDYILNPKTIFSTYNFFELVCSGVIRQKYNFIGNEMIIDKEIAFTCTPLTVQQKNKPELVDTQQCSEEIIKQLGVIHEISTLVINYQSEIVSLFHMSSDFLINSE